jgi:hypothetical protein
MLTKCRFLVCHPEHDCRKEKPGYQDRNQDILEDNGDPKGADKGSQVSGMPDIPVQTGPDDLMIGMDEDDGPENRSRDRIVRYLIMSPAHTRATLIPVMTSGSAWDRRVCIDPAIVARIITITIDK